MEQLRKVVINTCYGGFGLSDAAYAEYVRRAGVGDDFSVYCEAERDDPILVAVVEEFGAAALDRFSRLTIVSISATFVRPTCWASVTARSVKDFASAPRLNRSGSCGSSGVNSSSYRRIT